MSLHTGTAATGFATATTDTVVTTTANDTTTATAAATTGFFVLEERQHSGWSLPDEASRGVNPGSNTKPMSEVDQRFE
jgi:hypothetical protein